MPWKQIKEDMANFIDARYLPAPVMPNAAEQVVQLEDPSDMKKEQIVALSEHWRRLVLGSDLFRFSHILVNRKSREMEHALYDNSLGPQSLPQNSVPSASTQPAPVDTAYPNSNSGNELRGSRPPDIDPAQLEPKEHSEGPDVDKAPDPPLDGTGPQPKPGPTNWPPDIDPAQGEQGEQSEGPDFDRAPDQPLNGTGPQPRPRPKDGQSDLLDRQNMHAVPTAQYSHPAATNVLHTIQRAANHFHQGDSASQIEDALGQPCREPNKRKLDACLTIQFEATEKQRERGLEKLEKAHTERLAKQDALDSRPVKR